MAIFAISDLHLSFNKRVSLYNIDPELDQYKPMDVFGWNNHYERIREHWLQDVTEDDTVLIPGDISWALKLETAYFDFQWIHQLPGRKILSPGNHCYYAKSKKKIRDALPPNMYWIDGDSVSVNGYAIAATRGWLLPQDAAWEEERDRKIYERQVHRLRLALEHARTNYPGQPIIVMLHFPPLTTYASESGFFDLLREYSVNLCVYGHLHGTSHQVAVNGVVDGIELRLVSCDYLDYRPLQVRK